MIFRSRARSIGICRWRNWGVLRTLIRDWSVNNDYSDDAIEFLVDQEMQKTSGGADPGARRHVDPE